jgi:hypothetical protein
MMPEIPSKLGSNDGQKTWLSEYFVPRPKCVKTQVRTSLIFKNFPGLEAFRELSQRSMFTHRFYLLIFYSIIYVLAYFYRNIYIL